MDDGGQVLVKILGCGDLRPTHSPDVLIDQGADEIVGFEDVEGMPLQDCDGTQYALPGLVHHHDAVAPCDDDKHCRWKNECADDYASDPYKGGSYRCWIMSSDVRTGAAAGGRLGRVDLVHAI